MRKQIVKIHEVGALFGDELAGNRFTLLRIMPLFWA
jgi:hypothetical protein